MLLFCVGDEGEEGVQEQPLAVKSFIGWLWMSGSCQGAGEMVLGEDREALEVVWPRLQGLGSSSHSHC